MARVVPIVIILGVALNKHIMPGGSVVSALDFARSSPRGDVGASAAVEMTYKIELLLKQ